MNQISLSGHPALFRLDEGAYEVLRRYLERARQALKEDPDQEEVMRDLEQSIGEKLANLLQTDERIVTIADVNAVLAEVGPVDTGSHEPTPASEPRRGRRRLYWIKQGQQIFGVCQGLAAYADVNVDWLRFFVLVLISATAGVFGGVYLILGLALPVVETREEYFAMQEADSDRP